jgi:hypothetical protein
MESVASSHERGAHERGNIGIRARRLRRTNADRFIGQADRQGIAIGFAVRHHCANAHLATSPQDTNGDFSTISDENFSNDRHTQPSFITRFRATTP